MEKLTSVEQKSELSHHNKLLTASQCVPRFEPFKLNGAGVSRGGRRERPPGCRVEKALPPRLCKCRIAWDLRQPHFLRNSPAQGVPILLCPGPSQQGPCLKGRPSPPEEGWCYTAMFQTTKSSSKRPWSFTRGTVCEKGK